MSILSMCEYVYKCMGMYDLFLCLEMEGLYHIYQQFSELLSCILLEDEVYVYYYIGEKSGNKLVFMGYGGVGF